MKQDQIEKLVDLHEGIKAQYDRVMGFIEYTTGTQFEYQHSDFRKSATLMKTLELLTGDELLKLREERDCK